MALVPGDLVEIVINQVWMSQQTLNVWQYEVNDWPGTITMVQMLEGYWNHVKATLRAMASSSVGDVFISLRGRELNNASGEYAEFDVPTAEKSGTRATGTDAMPPFNAGGARLVVGTRVTKPGQKRYAFLVEADNVAGVLQTSMKNLIIAHLNVMTVELTLGAPAALLKLQPQVMRKDDNGFVTAHQDITGYIVNNNVTSQNSRKIGRGA